MLLAPSETNPASWRVFFSRSVSESSSQTIRIRAPSGTFNVKRERVLLSPVVSRVCVRRLIPRTLHFCVPVLGLTQICHHLLSESSHRLGASLTQAAADRAGPWICRDWAETVTKRTPKKRFEASEATRVISKELNFSDFSLARISSIVLRTIFSSSIPKTVVLISPARQKKVHPAWRISRSNPDLSRSLTNLQPGTLHSLSHPFSQERCIVLLQLALAVGRPAKSYGCGQRRFFPDVALHLIQLAVCCLQEGFNRFAVLRIGSHPNACGKWRLLTIRCKPIANARRDKLCGCGRCLGQHDGKLVAPVSRGCIDSPTKQTEHLADAA